MICVKAAAVAEDEEPIWLAASSYSSSPNEVYSCCAKADGGCAAPTAGIMPHTRVTVIRITGGLFEPIWERE